MLSLPPILTRFVEQTPIPVMARALIERVVGVQALDAWFEEQRAGQYTRELLFSTEPPRESWRPVVVSQTVTACSAS